MADSLRDAAVRLANAIEQMRMLGHPVIFRSPHLAVRLSDLRTALLEPDPVAEAREIIEQLIEAWDCPYDAATTRNKARDWLKRHGDFE